MGSSALSWAEVIHHHTKKLTIKITQIFLSIIFEALR
jgi:hypothetical protein